MISTADILRATGLRSSKTLSRWAKAGVIPEPTVGTHPSGRGKTSYWPDWVLDRCIAIRELQKKGHSLRSAAMALELARIEQAVEWATSGPTPEQQLEDTKIDVGDREISLLDVFLVEVLARLDAAGLELSRTALLRKLRAEGAIATAIQLVHTGYNPVAFCSADSVRVVPDFAVAHRLSNQGAEAQPAVIVPLLPALVSAYEKLGKPLSLPPLAYPAPLIWRTVDRETVQFSIYPGGGLGFEIIHGSERLVGVE